LDILDLFAGLGGEQRRSEIEKMGHKYVTLDINPKFNCNITKDIMAIDDLGTWDFIWASVPCETWSVASLGHHWNKDGTPKTQNARFMIDLVNHTIKLIKKSYKIGWVIENPRGKLRKMPFMQEFNLNTVTYCQYGESRMKPTDLWYGGFEWESRPMCKNGDSCHVRAPRGSRTGTQGIKDLGEKSVVPLPLWIEILNSVEKYA
jgi:hypothetical protein